ncbi:MAG TPA: glycosyltransferase family 4 protein, partial [Roseiflexaceae bacterium]|nr:glycosyltransferase family 4 protein [Roseiflexaceae bacterium]
MRILMASDFYPPFIGGAERQVQLLSQELALRGHTVGVATVWHSGQPVQQDDAGVDVRRLKGLTTRVPWFSKDPRRRFHPPFPDPGMVWGLRRLVRQWRPELVHAHGWIAYSCAAALLGTSIPLVISVRDYGYTCALRTLLHGGQVCDGPAPAKCLACAAQSYGLLKSAAAVGGVFTGRALLMRKIAATHSVSTFVQKTVRRDLLRSRLGSWKLDRESIPDIVVPSFLIESGDATLDQAYTDRLPDRPYILFVGALQPHKGLGPLLAAYEQLEKPPPLVLIGSVWPETPKQFPANVTVLHNVPHHVVMAAWERSLFGVAPSVWPDPLPGVVREGMSKGKAVIATSIGGNTDMIHDGETGLLIPPGDVDALAAAMRRLIDDRVLRDRLGQAGQRSARQFAAAA